MKRITRIALAGAAALSLGLAAATVSAAPFGYGPGYYGMGPGMMYGYGGGFGLGTLLFWGLIIFAVVMLVRGFGGWSNPVASKARDKTALDILAERYARGEIDKAEFEQTRSGLAGTGAATADQRRQILKASATERS